jgi:hypothetical protein
MPAPTGEIWAKSAVVGGLWASFEIVIGSSLHNMHIPFSGSFLTFMATIFMISFYRLCPQKGLIWRAGLICALMKSISPSAVILGPMTGIFLEALLVELFLRIFGHNPSGYILAGMASQLSVLIHKAGSLLIIYGLDLVRIYENFFKFILGQFNNINISPLQAIFLITLLYALAGMLAAIIGIYIGKKSETAGQPGSMPGPIDLKASGWEKPAPGQVFYIWLMILHLLLLPVFLYAFNNLGLHPLIIVVFALYITFCLIWYRRIKYRLMKPVFWMHLVIIAVFAGLFWESPDAAGGSVRLEGWVMGLSLNLRAVLVITGFSALSTELRNPRLKSMLFTFGFSKVYAALSTAFAALPFMMERGASGKHFLAHPIRSIRRLLADAGQWLYVLQQYDESAL